VLCKRQHATLHGGTICEHCFPTQTLNTGDIPDVCREWQRRTPVNQTWADLWREFARSQREQRIISITARVTGYHTANVAEHYVHN
jgi:hypothetical protein